MRRRRLIISLLVGGLAGGCGGRVADDTDPSMSETGVVAADAQLNDGEIGCGEYPPVGGCVGGADCEFPDACSSSEAGVPRYSCVDGVWRIGSPVRLCADLILPDGCPRFRPQDRSGCSTAEKACRYDLCSSPTPDLAWVWWYMCRYDETGSTTRWMSLKVDCAAP